MTVTRVTRRDSNREGYLADPLTMYSIDYIFNDAFSMSMFHKLVFGEFNLDLDHVYDRCEEQNLQFEPTLKALSKKLYSICNPFQKNKLIYKYFHNLGIELDQLTDRVLANLRDITNINELINPDMELVRITNLIKTQYQTKLNNYALMDLSPEYFESTEFRNLRCIDEFLFNHLEIYGMAKKDLTQTFNNVITNQYNKRMREGDRALSYLIGEQFNRTLQSRSGTFNTTISNLVFQPTLTNTTTTTTQINYNITEATLPPTQTSTIINNMNDALGWEDLLPTNYRSNNVTLVSKQKPTPITKKTPGVKVLNKSLKIIRKFIPQKELNAFLNCIEIYLPGNKFVFGFKLRSRNDLIKYSDSINNYSITWDLNVYMPDLTKVARSCITFKKSPILDQVLSVWMMLKAGNEDNVLLNSGWFDKNYTLYNEILYPYIQQLKEEDKNKKLNRIHNSILDLTTEDTLDGSVRFRNSRTERFLNDLHQRAEIKSFIKNWIKNYLLSKGFDPVLYEYTTNLDVSWGEAVDYEAFNLFNINCFDNLVKPLKWKKDYFRFKNRILLDSTYKTIENIWNLAVPYSARIQTNLDSRI